MGSCRIMLSGTPVERDLDHASVSRSLSSDAKIEVSKGVSRDRWHNANMAQSAQLNLTSTKVYLRHKRLHKQSVRMRLTDCITCSFARIAFKFFRQVHFNGSLFAHTHTLTAHLLPCWTLFVAQDGNLCCSHCCCCYGPFACRRSRPSVPFFLSSRDEEVALTSRNGYASQSACSTKAAIGATLSAAKSTWARAKLAELTLTCPIASSFTSSLSGFTRSIIATQSTVAR